MQSLFNVLCESPVIASWCEPDMVTMNGHDFKDYDDTDIVGVHVALIEELNRTTKRSFEIDGHTIHQGIERLLKGEVFASDETAGRLLRAVLDSDSDLIDGEIVDSIVQAGLFNDIVFG
ncbi:hypothetical protein [Burkholderia pseudomallei]|uniref:hypothetical protein n=1 Tax=Burkholderia pseudomallei TaxID=28450 RepID=UPI0012AF7756|nr:hypothetical protein [Burkholderia pseudomallei]